MKKFIMFAMFILIAIAAAIEVSPLTDSDICSAAVAIYNGTGSATQLVDQGLYKRNNLTNTSSPTFNVGKIDGGMEFEASENDYWNASCKSLNSSCETSGYFVRGFCAWFAFESTANDMMVFSDTSGDGGFRFTTQGTKNYPTYVLFNDGTGIEDTKLDFVSVTRTFLSSGYHHYCVFDFSNVTGNQSLYGFVDGVWNQTNISGDVHVYGGDNYPFKLGNSHTLTGTYAYDGNISQFILFNASFRTFSMNDIASYLYNSNASRSIDCTGDVNTAPTLGTPSTTPATLYTDSVLNCTVSYTDADADQGNVTLNWYINQTLVTTYNSTAVNVLNGSTVNYTGLTIPLVAKANYTCQASGRDNSSLAAASTNSTSKIVKSPPSIVNYNVTNNDHSNNNNINFTFNYSDYDGDQSNCALLINSTNYGNLSVTLNNTHGRNNTPSLPADGAYSWLYRCTDDHYSVNSAAFIYVLDTINPDITTVTPMPTNLTIIYASDSTYDLNFYCDDTYLFEMVANITNVSGQNVSKQWEWYDINTTNQAVVETINYSSWVAGQNYTLNIACTDDHTAKYIPNYAVHTDKAKAELSFDTDKGTNIFLKLKNTDVPLIDIYPTKLTDRYTYDFAMLGDDTIIHTYEFKFTSSEKISYRGSLYPYPSFVTGKHWVDFNLDTPYQVDYTVEKLDNFTYSINIKTRETYLQFKSLGGLNIQKESYLIQYSNTSAPAAFCLNCTSVLLSSSGIQYIPIPRWSTMLNFTFNLIGVNFNLTDCYQEFANETTCGQTIRGNYTNNSDNYWYYPPTRFYDGLYGSGPGTTGRNNGGVVIIEYVKPNGTYYANWTFCNTAAMTCFNLTLSENCLNSSYTVKINVTSNELPGTAFVNVTCLGGAGWEPMYYATGAYNAWIWEEAIYWKIDTVPKNVSVYFNGTLLYNQTGDFNSSVNVTGLKVAPSTIQYYIDECPVPSGRNCLVPINITWYRSGYVNFSYSNISFLPYQIEYETPLVVFQPTTFILRLNTNTTDNSSAKLLLGNVNYTPVKTVDATTYLSLFNVTMPFPDLFTSGVYSATYYHNWTYAINYSNGTSKTERTLSYSQAVTNFVIDNCTLSANETLRLNFFGEDYPFNYFTTSVEGLIEYWKFSSSYVKNYSFNFTGQTNYSLCITPMNETLYLNAYFKHIGDAGYTHRYYMRNATVTNTSQNVSMYNFNSTTDISSLNNIIRSKSSYLFLPNIYIKLMRYYVGENVWRLVQMDRTDNNGNAHFDIKEISTDYKMIFQDGNNNVLKTTDNMKFVCTAGVCEVTFLIDETVTTLGKNLSVGIDYDNSSEIVTVSWNDPTGATSAVTVMVTKEGGARITSICEQTLPGPAGVVICDTTGYDGLILVRVSASASPPVDMVMEYIQKGITLNLVGKGLLTKEEGAFWTGGFMLTCGMAGFFSPIAGIVLTIFAMIATFFLGINTVFNIATIMGVIVMAIVLGLKVRK